MTNYESVCKLNKSFGVLQWTPESLTTQLSLIHEECDEVAEALGRLMNLVEAGAKQYDIDGATEDLRAEIADLLVVTYGMGYVIDADTDADFSKKMATNFKKVMTKPEAAVLVARYQGKGLSVEAIEYDKGMWVVKSTRDQWLAHKHYPKGKVLKRI